MKPLPRLISRVASADGTTLAVQEWGHPDGPAVLLIHGGLQSHRCWERQVGDPALAGQCRLVTFDLRGHGDSAKPEGDGYYRPPLPWADDLAAVIAALSLRQPTLVGWSFGGRVIGDYLSVYGAGQIGAINYVAAATTSNRSHFGPGLQALDRAGSDDPATMRVGTRDFVRACFARSPSDAELEAVLDYNMQTPLHVRRSMRDRPAAYAGVLHTLRLPALATHGMKDGVLLPSLSEYTASAVPGCRLSLYADVGHSPFWENADRFNRELSVLVLRAAQPDHQEAMK